MTCQEYLIIERRLDAAARRLTLPSGTPHVAVGLSVNGLCTYAFLALASSHLDPGSYSALAVVWGLVSLLGAGVFQPLEQELSRATSERASHGVGSAPVVRTTLSVGVLAVVVIAVSTGVAWFVGLDRLLDERISLAISIVVALGGFMLTEVVRGLIAGRHRFSAYGRSLALEGATRLVGVTVLLIVGVDSVVIFGVIVALSFYVAAVGGVIGPRPFANPGPPVTTRELFPVLGLLLTMAISEAFLLNIGPVAVAALSSSDADAGRFLNGAVIARLPIFMFQAIKIAMLPAHVELASSGRYSELRQSTHRLLLTIGSFGAITTIGSGLLGPFITQTLFGDALGYLDMFLLGLSSGGAMIAVVLSLTLLSVGRSRLAAIGWGLGVAAFFACLALPLEPMVRVEVAIVSGFAVAGGAMFLSANTWFAAREAVSPHTA